MLSAEEFHSWDARANTAITHLCPAVERAITTGRPVSVSRYPTSYAQCEFVALAVDLCRRAAANAAIVATSEHTISVVPLAVTPAPARRRRAVDTRVAV